MIAPASTHLRFGFGCGNLGSELDYKTSCSLLETAYECGFRHFDVAPSYGHGNAERIVGDVLASVRSDVTIVTKAGIAHPKGASGLRAVRKLFLPVKKMFPSVWKRASSQANRAVAARGRFGRADIEASLQESLRRLRTDRVDALLLHEVQPHDVGPDLLAVLQSFREQDHAGAVGIATSVDASVQLLQAHPDAFDWVQANHYWSAFLADLRPGRHSLVTHRCLRSGMRVVQSAAFNDELARDDSARELRDVLADSNRLPALLLSAGLAQNAGGHLLVSSSRADRIREFAQLALRPTTGSLVTRLNEHFSRLASREAVTDA